MKKNYHKTLIACYLGFITQAISANFAPLLFLTFHRTYHISLGKIAFISTIFFFTQLLVDLFCARYVDKIGYRRCVVASEILSACGLIGLAFLPNILPNAYAGILLSAMIYAAGSGLIEVLVSPIVEACPFDNKDSVMSLLHSFFTKEVLDHMRERLSDYHQKLMRYKPQNISELSAFVAAIRSGFKSMYPTFERRVPFDYGVPVIDNLIQTKEFPYSFILYQENLMTILNFSGFPMDQCYGIIKDIAKKHPEKVKPLKAQFISGLCDKLQGQCPPGKEPVEIANQIWQIINDATAYSFNSSHSACMAYDSLYNAWQKATYPYEFYEVCLQHFSNKGKKEKVAALKAEMLRGFGIHEGPIQWGHDNRKFTADKENHAIDPSLLSIKGLSQGCANDLWKMYQSGKFTDFYSLWKEMSHTRSLNSAKIETLVLLDYFKPFAGGNKILKFISACNDLYGRSQFPKDTKSSYKPYIEAYSTTSDQLKTYKDFQYDSALQAIWNDLPDEPLHVKQVLDAQSEYLGYLQYQNPSLASTYHYILSIDGKYKNKTIALYQLATGQTVNFKIRPSTMDQNPIAKGDIIKVFGTKQEGKWSRTDAGWVQSTTDFNTFLYKYSHVR